MASLRFAALLLALFCIFLMQQSVESGFVKRDTPEEPSGFEKIQEELSKAFDQAKSKLSEAAKSINTDEFQKQLGNFNQQIQDVANKVSDQIKQATADIQKKD